MRYEVELVGDTGIIAHNAATGLDLFSATNLEISEISRKRGSNRTQADEERIRQLECLRGLYLDANDKPTFPAAALRAAIEAAARKIKQGPMVREGLVVESLAFTYDTERYGETVEDVAIRAQFTVPVVIQRARILRTRPKFDPPWSIAAVVDCDDELVDMQKLSNWLIVAGSRIGLGDWRPQKSGNYGRFTAQSVKQIR